MRRTTHAIPAALAIVGTASLLSLLAVHSLGLQAHAAALTGMPHDTADPALGALALAVGLIAPVVGPPCCLAAAITWLWR